MLATFFAALRENLYDAKRSFIAQTKFSDAHRQKIVRRKFRSTPNCARKEYENCSSVFNQDCRVFRDR